ncbi:MAG: site-specific DNA-methyltransferase [Deltaproteobacteria bacterium]|jgi:DNA modification methylase|nr:site-specific DNA-methyltransferase [Deltaproteobacteria bacterium]
MADNIRWGLDNPHPFSQMKTELIWEGKYDEYGKRRAVDIAGCAMPLQKIETVDEPASRAYVQDKLFDPVKAHQDDFRNLLIWGDNKLVMASLLKEFKGKIDLIYIDPPYDVGSDFTCDVIIGDRDEKLHKDQSVLEQVAYQDTWGKGVDSYLQMMYERFILIRDLLSEEGSLFVHCDWHVGQYIRALLDDVFGKKNFLNEIIWYYYNKLHDSRKHILPRAHDVIFRYAKTQGRQIHHPLKEKREKPVTKLKYKKVNGQIQNIIGLDGKVVTYTSEHRTIDDIWRLRCLQPANKSEYTRFRTQKPIDLLQRIIDLASNEDSIVMDVFCGTGTTLLAAESRGRKWIGCDLGRFPVHLSRKRLIELQRTLYKEGKQYRSFDVYNLGRYERQWWQKERLEGADEEHRRVVMDFYRAEHLPNAAGLLHGRKGRAFVHVDGIDSIFTRDELRSVVKAAKEAGAREVHCLAWEFEMDLRLICHELEAAHSIKIKLIPIPREIMEKNRTSPPPFLEMAVLEAEPVYRSKGGKRKVDIKLTKFLPSLAEVPSKELDVLKDRAMKSGFDFIDFWAVDFDWHKGKPFEHNWQDFRTRKNRSLKTVSDFGYDKYSKKGKHTACIKVIDVFGCDTSITVEVKI